MSREKSIDWLMNPGGSPGITKNYVFGCLKKCPYCYAGPIAKRLGMAERMAKCEMRFKYGDNWMDDYYQYREEYLQYVYNFQNFIPTFRPSVLAQKLPKKPTMIFFSMSEPAYWEPEWYEKILEKITQHMQHTFVILTKSPRIYEKYTFPHNAWLGVTIETQDILNEWSLILESFNRHLMNKIFLSIEPIMSKISIELLQKINIDWVIVGPETGRRKNRIKATPDMIEPFYDLETRVFMKESCKQIVNEKLRQEWPKGYLNE